MSISFVYFVLLHGIEATRARHVLIVVTFHSRRIHINDYTHLFTQLLDSAVCLNSCFSGLHMQPIRKAKTSSKHCIPKKNSSQQGTSIVLECLRNTTSCHVITHDVHVGMGVEKMAAPVNQRISSSPINLQLALSSIWSLLHCDDYITIHCFFLHHTVSLLDYITVSLLSCVFFPFLSIYAVPKTTQLPSIPSSLTLFPSSTAVPVTTPATGDFKILHVV